MSCLVTELAISECGDCIFARKAVVARGAEGGLRGLTRFRRSSGASLPRSYNHAGRFLRGRSEIPEETIEYVARQVA
jgi:hypothetical protein